MKGLASMPRCVFSVHAKRDQSSHFFDELSLSDFAVFGIMNTNKTPHTHLTGVTCATRIEVLRNITLLGTCSNNVINVLAETGTEKLRCFSYIDETTLQA